MHYIPERYGFRWFVIIFNSFKINILLRILLEGKDEKELEESMDKAVKFFKSALNE